MISLPLEATFGDSQRDQTNICIVENLKNDDHDWGIVIHEIHQRAEVAEKRSPEGATTPGAEEERASGKLCLEIVPKGEGYAGMGL